MGGFEYKGPERRCGGQRRRPVYDPKAEEMMHTEEMIGLPSIICNKAIKRDYGYDAGVLYWHVSNRHKFTGVKFFFPHGDYHKMLEMTPDQLEKACQLLEEANLLKRVHYDGKTGYRVLKQ